MSISGNLETMELSELLQWVALSTKTGTLLVENDTTEIKIFFDEGSVAATESSDPGSRLGQFLLAARLIDEEQLSTALESQKAGEMLLGRILVATNLVKEADVVEMLEQKARECVFQLLLHPSGAFRFVDDESLEGEMVPMSLDVTGLMLKAAEQVDEWKRIRQFIPSTKCVPVAVGFLEDTDSIPGAQSVLALVDDDRSIEDICTETRLSEYFVNRVLFATLEKGRLKIVRPRVVGSSAGSVNLDSVNAATHLAIAEHLISEGDLNFALRHLGAASSLDPQSGETSMAIDSAEARIRSTLEQEGIQLNCIPVLNVDSEEISGLRLSPEEGFILSRIDGDFDIDSILKISPMPPLDARLVFRRLVQAGHISLEQPTD